jgi:small subunit ribosomal protein S13
MARIAGVNIPNHQHTVIGLTAIFGIGLSRSLEICKLTGVPNRTIRAQISEC